MTAVEPEAGSTALHSGMSGEMMLLSDEQWGRVQAFLAADDDGEAIADQLGALVAGRFLTDDSVDELAVLRGRYLQSRFAGSLGLTVVTSLGCNFDCPYCFEDKSPSRLKPAVRDAIRAFQNAIAIRPRDVPSNVALSRLLLSTDQLEGAVAFGERAIKLDPDNGEAHLALARAYSAVGRGTDAIREYEAAIELIEPPIEVMFALVNAYAEEKRYEEALSPA